ncbi:hypothetical protein ACFOUV_03050 [Oceanobacillus longus]|uniref:Uncharacterized protein n=1 Tax=Oceanobacillus longus TaxID=930120 RepID=A0ABV8GSD7_9BACI
MMKAVLTIVVMFSTVTLIYKWRYKVMNTLLAVGIIRKIMVSVSMNLPYVRNHILPELFNTKSHTY